ncbi:hypothetical protein H8356DRAFT_1087428 [Neocallimastix lanati (nom. inval.)]|jgi:hypothetical protein|uniref:Uncharacterized protein n=1 Tax=Neocallimastix californiae TaxID=1754190 RepID=A0A1Y2ET05_9FUNG|nr:hypothetical protein H8356DRAFT_1087428 [Neocallimastix sp. JGI-2020a]ORY74709.1 hypothetical protein LY90DRAFT_699237 [Neocallimastix californiae]|eukprot:ORY74709.1 hypothetical protein LY90DRAFT_699237 [Neocallimastix californiae]
MSSASIQVMTINNELKRKPVSLLDNMNAKQIKLDLSGLKTKMSSTNDTFENYIPTYTQYDNNTQKEKFTNSKISELYTNRILNTHNETHFVTEAPAPVPVDYCETCSCMLQHCKGCLDHTKLCGNPHCGNRQKGTTFCVACKGLDEYHPICRSCVEYPPYSAQTNQCGHCKGYFCAASLSNPSLKYTCRKCDTMVCWRCRTMCHHEDNTNEDEAIAAAKASVNIDILLK